MPQQAAQVAVALEILKPQTGGPQQQGRAAQIGKQGAEIGHVRSPVLDVETMTRRNLPLHLSAFRRTPAQVLFRN
ncbi:hypothetical protein GCM10011452_05790 [Gemmobacter lanyuensis]|uniref:Uncharacterized protein n=1 Tax=Gemmobacter lanyuensis TaxID=1054497 RepID=A0A918IM90_9RHOB|nr:hypothetical protein GCM10011452_05790 [Gemmobacter lanyuensis]